MDSICQGQGTISLFEGFLEDFLDESDFMDYFKATWYPRMGKWITAVQTLPIASQETCSAIEFYHNQMKVRLLNEKNPIVYQRTDWLVDKLNTKIHSYFWLDEYSGKDDFARYRKEEWVSGLTSWRKALEISDTDVVMEGGSAKVTDQLDRDRLHVVWNSGSQFGICECNWAEMGNLCEHMLKVISVWRKKKSATPSISLLQYQKVFMDMLQCAPHDSLIRDHAVSLAVFVQKQINGLVSESRNSSKGQPSSGNHDQELASGRSEDILYDKENGSLDRHGTHGRVTGIVGGQTNDSGDGRNSICGDGLAEEISCAEMDVDPSSICISPPGLHSVDEVVSSGVLSENTEKGLNSESEHLPSKDADATLANTNCFTTHALNKGGPESEMDMESISMDIPPSTMEFVEQCTVAHQNDAYSQDLKPVISNTVDADTLSIKTSPPITVHVESQAVEIAETSNSKKDNEEA
ncbi:hypothetical protein L484_027118 [Morus notabilis]|nr:hypothetical protein L484_027118 [Morus notabilis]